MKTAIKAGTREKTWGKDGIGDDDWSKSVVGIRKRKADRERSSRSDSVRRKKKNWSS
jgi:hypothetical protein